MNLYEILLTIHILGAVITGGICFYAGALIWGERFERYRNTSIMLAAIAGFEILTGTALSVISLQVSAQALCSRIGLYLGVVILFESILYARIKHSTYLFPIKAVVVPILSSLAVFTAALVYGF